MSWAKRMIARAMHRQLSRFDELYQCHAGQECYIFGDGVSLKWMDLREFSGRPSIIGNMMIYHKEIKALHIPYCAIMEPYFFWPVFLYRGYGTLQLIRNYNNKEYSESIRQYPETLFFINLSNYPVTRFPNARYVYRGYAPPFNARNPFKERADSHHGTLKFQLALAIYLGFKKAYLVGHDYTHCPSRSLHFYERGKGILNGLKYPCRDYIEYAKQHIDLVTVTLDGGSGVMDSIMYKELTGKEPTFRENIEIVDMDKLKSLATWDGYSIF